MHTKHPHHQSISCRPTFPGGKCFAGSRSLQANRSGTNSAHRTGCPRFWNHPRQPRRRRPGSVEYSVSSRSPAHLFLRTAAIRRRISLHHQNKQYLRCIYRTTSAPPDLHKRHIQRNPEGFSATLHAAHGPEPAGRSLPAVRPAPPRPLRGRIPSPGLWIDPQDVHPRKG